jgi:hypothetical protein
MSKTKRNRSGNEFGPEWKATADRRKWHNPPSSFKKAYGQYDHSEDKAFDRSLTSADPDEVLPPVHYKDHKWNYL